MDLRAILGRVLNEFRWSLIFQAALVAGPCIVCALLLKEHVPLRVGLISIVLLIPAERLRLNTWSILLVFAAVLFGIVLVFEAFPHQPLMIILAASLAAATVHLTYYGVDLRSLGTYVYIPALYLGCELRQEHAARWDLMNLLHWSLLAPLLVIAVRVFAKRCMRESLPPSLSASTGDHSMLSWLSDELAHYGPGNKRWRRDAIIMFLGVLASAKIMFAAGLPHPEWGVWSTASIITSDRASSITKARHRGISAVVGVMVGIIAAGWIPHSDFIGLLATMGVMFSLVGLKTYWLSFGTRCFFTVIGAAASGDRYHTGLARAGNVLIGIAVGAVAMLVAHSIVAQNKDPAQAAS